MIGRQRDTARPCLAPGLLALGLAAACGPTGSQAPASGTADPTAAPHESAARTSGADDPMHRVLGADELVSHVEPAEGDRAVVLNFWATWCPPCLAEMPDLVKLHQKRGKDGVRVVAVSVDLPMPRDAETAEQVFAFAKQKGFELPLVVLDADYDQTVELFDRFGGEGGIPFTVVFDADGEAVATHTGRASLAQFEEMLAETDS